jgi:Concanavalin A-like lectin/glucanases superfamily
MSLRSSSTKSTKPSCSRARAGLLLALTGLLAAACGDYQGSPLDANTLLLTLNRLGGRGQSQGTSTADVSAFSTTVYPLLRQYCSECHSGAGPGSPSIAHPDLNTAFHAVVDQRKVSFSNPPASRLVQRLTVDRHNCWSSCASDGGTMLAAIEQWVAASDTGGVAIDDTLASTTLRLADGVQDQSQERSSANLIALFEFKEGDGNVAHDTSGVRPAMDLQIQGGGVTWLGGYGLAFDDGRAIASADGSQKLYQRIASPQTGSQQYSIEAWVRTADIDQDGPARIASYSQGTGASNFSLGQAIYNYDFRRRSTALGIDDRGMPGVVTADEAQRLQESLQHVVVTYDLYHGTRLYVNGEYTGDRDPRPAARLWNWDPSFRFVVGNETSNNRQWKGQARMVAIYNRALTPDEIVQNYQAGVGKRLLLRFDVSQWAGAGSVVEFEASEFDAYSYLFCRPSLVKEGSGSVRVGNIQVAVNGEIPVSGQAFRTLDVTASGSKSALSQQCSVIPKSLGADQDRFTLVFERLGGYENQLEEPPLPPPPPAGVPEPRPTEGIRDFARLNETYAAVTGVDPLDPGVQATYQELEQALPPNYDVRSFVSSQQVGIAKLSLEYCDTLVEDPTLRDEFFGPGFAWDSPPDVAFADPAQRDVVFDALIDAMIGQNLTSEPSRAEVIPILDGLVNDLLATCTTTACGPDRTRTVVKGACAAVLSSAAVSIH